MAKVLYWFRNDLRLGDNPALGAAIGAAKSIAFVYVHDPRQWHKTCAGIPRLGWHRRRFLGQSLDELRAALEKQGYALVEVHGYPEKVLPEIVQQNRIDLLCFSRESAPEERSVENELIVSSKTTGFEIESYWTQFLITPDQLPDPKENLPQKFTDFRIKVETAGLDNLIPQTPVELTSAGRPERLRLRGDYGLTLDELIRLFGGSKADMTLNFRMPAGEEEKLLKRVLKPDAPEDKMKILSGGASSAANRLKNYIFEESNIKTYYSTRNGLLAPSDSTLFSAWLANGCMSAQEIYRSVRRYESLYGADRNSYWVIFELLWRDFFKHHLVTAGPRFFFPEGLYRRASGREPALPDEELQSRIEEILSCRTQDVFINANMRELLQTGIMSNRGRQNVASYMIYDLKIPWTAGASIFESFLIDYDVASNWGNWAYIAGVSFDPRGGRKFNTVKQRLDYDPDGSYVAAWSD